MSYYSEHLRLKPVLDLARQLDIATNPAVEALFEAGNAGFQLWCTPYDHPAGWDAIPMTSGAFAKPCAYLASVSWGWEGEQITHLVLSTDAYALGDHARLGRREIHNRPEDLAWAKEKVRRLFEMAGVPMPPIVIQA